MNVIFVEPAFPANQRQFVRGLAEVGATVIGIGERPGDWVDDELRGWMQHYHQIGSVIDTAALRGAVEWIQDKVWIDRLEATVEAHILPAAEVREACHIPGTSRRTAWLCRDKPSMKEALRQAGVPTAASAAVHHLDQARDFAGALGYPLIVKPRAGAGAAGTSRVDSDEDLERALQAYGEGGITSVALEEFVEGHEAFYDTVSIDGVPTHDFVSHYFPNVLEAMRTRWISPQFVSTNRIDDVGDYDELKEMGRRVNEVLGIGTSATHMEWFFGPKGLRFSEIGCRPSGVGAWDLYAAGNEMDLYREWAHAIVHQSPSQRASRSYAAGMVALRPQADGVIRGYSGIDAMQAKYGAWVIDAQLPPAGTPTQPIEAGYMANAYVRMKHPDYDALRAMLNDVGKSITVHAG
jgi:formate-dependent phosphoribosylglycinamide formyltransferase (GAR transformylase)